MGKKKRLNIPDQDVHFLFETSWRKGVKAVAIRQYKYDDKWKVRQNEFEDRDVRLEDCGDVAYGHYVLKGHRKVDRLIVVIDGKEQEPLPVEKVSPPKEHRNVVINKLSEKFVRKNVVALINDKKLRQVPPDDILESVPPEQRIQLTEDIDVFLKIYRSGATINTLTSQLFVGQMTLKLAAKDLLLPHKVFEFNADSIHEFLLLSVARGRNRSLGETLNKAYKLKLPKQNMPDLSHVAKKTRLEIGKAVAAFLTRDDVQEAMKSPEFVNRLNVAVGVVFKLHPTIAREILPHLDEDTARKATNYIIDFREGMVREHKTATELWTKQCNATPTPAQMPTDDIQPDAPAPATRRPEPVLSLTMDGWSWEKTLDDCLTSILAAEKVKKPAVVERLLNLLGPNAQRIKAIADVAASEPIPQQDTQAKGDKRPVTLRGIVRGLFAVHVDAIKGKDGVCTTFDEFVQINIFLSTQPIAEELAEGFISNAWEEFKEAMDGMDDDVLTFSVQRPDVINEEKWQTFMKDMDELAKCALEQNIIPKLTPKMANDDLEAFVKVLHHPTLRREAVKAIFDKKRLTTSSNITHKCSFGMALFSLVCYVKFGWETDVVDDFKKAVDKALKIEQKPLDQDALELAAAIIPCENPAPAAEAIAEDQCDTLLDVLAKGDVPVDYSIGPKLQVAWVQFDAEEARNKGLEVILRPLHATWLRSWTNAVMPELPPSTKYAEFRGLVERVRPIVPTVRTLFISEKCKLLDFQTDSVTTMDQAKATALALEDVANALLASIRNKSASVAILRQCNETNIPAEIARLEFVAKHSDRLEETTFGACGVSAKPVPFDFCPPSTESDIIKTLTDLKKFSGMAERNLVVTTAANTVLPNVMKRDARWDQLVKVSEKQKRATTDNDITLAQIHMDSEVMESAKDITSDTTWSTIMALLESPGVVGLVDWLRDKRFVCKHIEPGKPGDDADPKGQWTEFQTLAEDAQGGDPQMMSVLEDTSAIRGFIGPLAAKAVSFDEFIKRVINQKQVRSKKKEELLRAFTSVDMAGVGFFKELDKIHEDLTRTAKTQTKEDIASLKNGLIAIHIDPNAIPTARNRTDTIKCFMFTDAENNQLAKEIKTRIPVTMGGDATTQEVREPHTRLTGDTTGTCVERRYEAAVDIVARGLIQSTKKNDKKDTDKMRLVLQSIKDIADAILHLTELCHPAFVQSHVYSVFNMNARDMSETVESITAIRTEWTATLAAARRANPRLAATPSKVLRYRFRTAQQAETKWRSVGQCIMAAKRATAAPLIPLSDTSGHQSPRNRITDGQFTTTKPNVYLAGAVHLHDPFMLTVDIYRHLVKRLPFVHEILSCTEDTTGDDVARFVTLAGCRVAGAMYTLITPSRMSTEHQETLCMLLNELYTGKKGPANVVIVEAADDAAAAFIQTELTRDSTIRTIDAGTAQATTMASLSKFIAASRLGKQRYRGIEDVNVITSELPGQGKTSYCFDKFFRPLRRGQDDRINAFTHRVSVNGPIGVDHFKGSNIDARIVYINLAPTVSDVHGTVSRILFDYTVLGRVVLTTGEAVDRNTPVVVETRLTATDGRVTPWPLGLVVNCTELFQKTGVEPQPALMLPALAEVRRRHAVSFKKFKAAEETAQMAMTVLAGRLPTKAAKLRGVRPEVWRQMTDKEKAERRAADRKHWDFPRDATLDDVVAAVNTLLPGDVNTFSYQTTVLRFLEWVGEFMIGQEIAFHGDADVKVFTAAQALVQDGHAAAERTEILEALEDDSHLPIAELFKDILRYSGNDTRESVLSNICGALGGKSAPVPSPKVYVMTDQSFNRIIAIAARVVAGVPTILCGSTGSGKTYTVTCIAERTGMDIHHVRVHAAHTEAVLYDLITDLFRSISRKLRNGDTRRTIIFFDELNTTKAVNVFKELICEHTMRGIPINDLIDRDALRAAKLQHSGKAIAFVGAINPYVKRSETELAVVKRAGLNLDDLGTGADTETTRLVYRVQKLPPTLTHYVIPFQSPNVQLVEAIKARIVDTVALLDNTIHMSASHLNTLTNVTLAAHSFMLSDKSPSRNMSFREVGYVGTMYHLLRYKKYGGQTGLLSFRKQADRHPETAARMAILGAVGAVYATKISDRRDLYIAMYRAMFSEKDDAMTHEDAMEVYVDRKYNGMMECVTDHVQKPDGICLNNALSENVFMTVACIEARIPLYIIGLPGSSKTLSKTIVKDAMEVSNDASQLFSALRGVKITTVQCSPITRSQDIENAFKTCEDMFAKQEPHLRKTAVLCLEEIGLAEMSPEMPLKILHAKFDAMSEKPVDQRIGFIAMSNWALDPAKLSRGLWVLRHTPKKQDLVDTAMEISAIDSTEYKKKSKTKRGADTAGDDKYKQRFVRGLANGYSDLVEDMKREAGQDVDPLTGGDVAIDEARYPRSNFIAQRDFFCAAKLIGDRLRSDIIIDDIIAEAVCRNFGGFPPAVQARVDRILVRAISDKEAGQENEADLKRLSSVSWSTHVRSALKERAGHSRYPMLITSTPLATYTKLLETGVFKDKGKDKDKGRATLIYGSSFTADSSYTAQCVLLTKIKHQIESGGIAVLTGLSKLYEACYDLFNAAYLKFANHQFVDLGFGALNIRVRVHKDFRILVLATPQEAYRDFPIPLLNRFEKYYVDVSDNTGVGKSVVDDVTRWVNQCDKNMATVHQGNPAAPVFVGYGAAVHLAISQLTLDAVDKEAECKGKKRVDADVVTARVKDLLFQTASEEALHLLSPHLIPNTAHDRPQTVGQCVRASVPKISKEKTHKRIAHVFLTTYAAAVTETQVKGSIVRHVPEFTRDDVTVTPIKAVQTSDDLSTRLAAWTSRPTAGALVLVIDTVDIAFTQGGVIRTVEHIISDAAREYTNNKKGRVAGLVPPTVVLLIHLNRVDGLLHRDTNHLDKATYRAADVVRNYTDWVHYHVDHPTDTWRLTQAAVTQKAESVVAAWSGNGMRGPATKALKGVVHIEDDRPVSEPKGKTNIVHALINEKHIPKTTLARDALLNVTRRVLFDHSDEAQAFMSDPNAKMFVPFNDNVFKTALRSTAGTGQAAKTVVSTAVIHRVEFALQYVISSFDAHYNLASVASGPVWAAVAPHVPLQAAVVSTAAPSGQALRVTTVPAHHTFVYPFSAELRAEIAFARAGQLSLSPTKRVAAVTAVETPIMIAIRPFTVPAKHVREVARIIIKDALADKALERDAILAVEPMLVECVASVAIGHRDAVPTCRILAAAGEVLEIALRWLGMAIPAMISVAKIAHYEQHRQDERRQVSPQTWLIRASKEAGRALARTINIPAAPASAILRLIVRVGLQLVEWTQACPTGQFEFYLRATAAASHVSSAVTALVRAVGPDLMTVIEAIGDVHTAIPHLPEMSVHDDDDSDTDSVDSLAARRKAQARAMGMAASETSDDDTTDDCDSDSESDFSYVPSDSESESDEDSDFGDLDTGVPMAIDSFDAAQLSAATLGLVLVMCDALAAVTLSRPTEDSAYAIKPGDVLTAVDDLWASARAPVSVPAVTTVTPAAWTGGFACRVVYTLHDAMSVSETARGWVNSAVPRIVNSLLLLGPIADTAEAIVRMLGQCCRGKATRAVMTLLGPIGCYALVPGSIDHPWLSDLFACPTPIDISDVTQGVMPSFADTDGQTQLVAVGQAAFAVLPIAKQAEVGCRAAEDIRTIIFNTTTAPAPAAAIVVGVFVQALHLIVTRWAPEAAINDKDLTRRSIARLTTSIGTLLSEIQDIHPAPTEDDPAVSASLAMLLQHAIDAGGVSRMNETLRDAYFGLDGLADAICVRDWDPVFTPLVFEDFKSITNDDMDKLTAAIDPVTPHNVFLHRVKHHPAPSLIGLKGAQVTWFMPTSMSTKEVMHAIMTPGGQDGRVTTWECPNGHIYVIGECGMPMETAKCQECGAAIGGTNHNELSGNRQSLKNSMHSEALGFETINNDAPARRVRDLNSFDMVLAARALVLLSHQDETYTPVGLRLVGSLASELQASPEDVWLLLHVLHIASKRFKGNFRTAESRVRWETEFAKAWPDAKDEWREARVTVKTLTKDDEARALLVNPSQAERTEHIDELLTLAIDPVKPVELGTDVRQALSQPTLGLIRQDTADPFIAMMPRTPALLRLMVLARGCPESQTVEEIVDGRHDHDALLDAWKLFVVLVQATDRTDSDPGPSWLNPAPADDVRPAALSVLTSILDYVKSLTGDLTDLVQKAPLGGKFVCDYLPAPQPLPAEVFADVMPATDRFFGPAYRLMDDPVDALVEWALTFNPPVMAIKASIIGHYAPTPTSTQAAARVPGLVPQADPTALPPSLIATAREAPDALSVLRHPIDAAIQLTRCVVNPTLPLPQFLDRFNIQCPAALDRVPMSSILAALDTIDCGILGDYFRGSSSRALVRGVNWAQANHPPFREVRRDFFDVEFDAEDNALPDIRAAINDMDHDALPSLFQLVYRTLVAVTDHPDTISPTAPIVDWANGIDWLDQTPLYSLPEVLRTVKLRHGVLLCGLIAGKFCR